MRPIVDGLQEEFGESITFIMLNAEDEIGRPVFQQLSLMGHPGVVLFSVEQKEVFRSVGVIEDSLLRRKVLEQISFS
jgi:hypothetical protein